eukprot:SAG11_NODE_6039_length_1403_cov_12.738497_2_plen_215_part_00
MAGPLLTKWVMPARPLPPPPPPLWFTFSPCGSHSPPVVHILSSLLTVPHFLWCGVASSVLGDALCFLVTFSYPCPDCQFAHPPIHAASNRYAHHATPSKTQHPEQKPVQFAMMNTVHNHVVSTMHACPQSRLGVRRAKETDYAANAPLNLHGAETKSPPPPSARIAHRVAHLVVACSYCLCLLHDDQFLSERHPGHAEDHTLGIWSEFKRTQNV